MASSFDLSGFQREVLASVFARQQDFFLTGGGALVGFYLHHRHTDDLDLFTGDSLAFEHSGRLIDEVAVDIGATAVQRHGAPAFRRCALVRGDETVVVDLVLDRVPQLHDDKPVIDGIRIDPLDEILANKLCALVGRAEERDVVDAMAIEQAGLRVEDALPAALAKDGGCTAGNLAWLLSELQIPADTTLPGGVRGEDLARYVTDLVTRLRRAAAPRG